MDVVAVDVFVLHDEVWHIGEAHHLHIVMGKAGEVGIAQPVVGVWI